MNQPSRPRALSLCLAVLLAGAHFAIAVHGTWHKSTTSDELAHVTGGYAFNVWHDYRFHPENGLLPQRWQALPAVLAAAPAFAPRDDAAWRKADVWLVGYRFFYGENRDHLPMLRGARALNAVFGAATVLLVFGWARRLWGEAGAVFAALLAALCPTMLAHSALATSDMGMTFFFLASTGAYWRHLHDGRARWLVLSATLFGLACVVKYTAVLLLPMFAALALLRLSAAAPLGFGKQHLSGWPARAGGLALSLLGHGLAAVFTIWAFGGFRFAAFNPDLPGGAFSLPWDFLLTIGGAPAAVIQLCRDWHLLPEGWLYGLAFVLKHAEARGAFLDGDYSIYGWVSFFPKAFLYKTPPTLLLAIAGAAVFTVLRLRTGDRRMAAGWLYRTAPLVVLFAVYWAFSLNSHLNIGHRHILPTYPVLYIFGGVLGWAAVRTATRSRRAGTTLGAALAALGLGHAAVTTRIHPHHLAYFSPVVGGPAQGYRHLVDSSLDWGQDLPALQAWLQANRRPGEPLYLSYFGTGEPAYYGIDAIHLPMLPSFDRPHPWTWLEPGLYAISATMLQHVYMPDRGPWTAEYEREYQQLRQNDAHFRALKADPHGHPELMREVTPEQWSKAWTHYERLRFARLCHYLRARRPDAMPGYSILVYRLAQAELDAALAGDLRALADAMRQGTLDDPR